MFEKKTISIMGIKQVHDEQSQRQLAAKLRALVPLSHVKDGEVQQGARVPKQNQTLMHTWRELGWIFPGYVSQGYKLSPDGVAACNALGSILL